MLRIEEPFLKVRHDRLFEDAYLAVDVDLGHYIASTLENPLVTIVRGRRVKFHVLFNLLLALFVVCIAGALHEEELPKQFLLLLVVIVVLQVIVCRLIEREVAVVITVWVLVPDRLLLLHRD